jgi:Zn-dependent protease/CBS domain-containing protein
VIGWTFWQDGQSLAVVVRGLGLYLSLFGCVLLHEYGHALTARRYGIKTRDITLLPIGGLARLERMPDQPAQEFWVAIAGPAVNVAIAGILFLVLSLSGGAPEFKFASTLSGSFLNQLMVVNVFLAAFNLLPAFPMDGGRVLRSLLAMRMDYARATQIAATLGRVMAFVFGFYAVMPNGPKMLLLIAFFVWIGASQEASLAQMKSTLGGIPVSEAMLRDFYTLTPKDSLGRAVELILAGSQHDFPVVEDGRTVGILSRNSLMAALAKHGAQADVNSAMSREFQETAPNELLETAFGRLQETQADCLPVLSRGQLVGLLTSENVGEYLLIRNALRSASGRTRPIPHLHA